MPDPLRLAAAYLWEDKALAAVREESSRRAGLTSFDMVRVVLDTIGKLDTTGNEKEENP